MWNANPTDNSDIAILNILGRSHVYHTVRLTIVIWKIFKLLISALCLGLASIIINTAPTKLIAWAIASFILFLAWSLWRDYSKPLSMQNIPIWQRNIAKIAIWGLIICFTVILVYVVLNSHSLLHLRWFIQLLTTLLKVQIQAGTTFALGLL